VWLSPIISNELFGSGFIAAPVSLSLIRSHRNFFWFGLLCIGSGKIVEVAFDSWSLSILLRNSSAAARRVSREFSRDRLCCENAAKSRPMRIGLAKNRAVLAGTVLEEDWRKIDYVNFAFTQFVVKSRKEWSRRFT